MKHLILGGAVLAAVTTTAALAEEMKLAVTTSFHNSGLSDILLPQIKADTGIEVQLLVVGTGQAIRLGGEAGDVDAILVHSRKAEEAFLAGGYGTHRREIMYNDFVLIGPPSDDPPPGSRAQTRRRPRWWPLPTRRRISSAGGETIQARIRKNSACGRRPGGSRRKATGTRLSAQAWARR